MFFYKKLTLVLRVGVFTEGMAKRDNWFAQHATMLQAIVESSDDAIISKTLDGIIRSWNRGAERIFGYLAEEIVGKHISTIIPQNRLPEEDLIISRLRKGEKIDHFDTQRRTKSGRLIDISLTVSPIKNRRGKIVGASKIARDISDRKRHEQLLREEEQRKDDFIALLAHELRNPLAPITSATEALKMARDISEDSKWAIDIISRQLGHMGRLIDDLLDVSRISQNKLELRKEFIRLDDFLQPAIEASEPMIQEAQHTLITDIPKSPIYVCGDGVRLSQIITNLLTNSAKFTPPGGTIWLSVKRIDTDVAITVKDSGMGISAEMIPRVFEMFIQGTNVPFLARGLGIGLSLAKRLVELHGGTIEVFSEGAGKGSMFTVTLPAVPDVEDTQHTPKKPSLVSPLRILVVDDNKDAVTALEMVLRLQGHQTAIAYDGFEAVSASAKFLPDVILLDIGMPKMNGYEAARMIRTQPGGKNIKIIAITGWGQDSDKKRGREAGFDHHLTKPVNADELSLILASTKVRL
jgi:PAS domain S-box-containing protein